MHSGVVAHLVDQCRHRFRCLHCSDTDIFCDCAANCHKDHPKQPLVTSDFLLGYYGSKADYAGYAEIDVFTCPYCDRRKLSVGTLYDHITLEHLDVPFDVRCPICVCFGSNNTLLGSVHLSRHLVDDHSVTTEQYQEQLLVYNDHDERELLIFLASTLPPTYHAAGEFQSEVVRSSSFGSRTPAESRRFCSQTQSACLDPPHSVERTCSICLDTVDAGRTLACRHKFHVSCIGEWLQQNATCPVCRKPTVV